MSKHTDGAPTRRASPISQADFARRAGVDRSTISRAFQGPLRSALLPGKRCDATHPAVIAWARTRRLDPKVLLGTFGRIMALKQEAAPRSASEPHEDSDDAGMTVEEFAARAEVAVDVLSDALRAELAPALLWNGRIDACSLSALQFMAAHPFRNDADGRAIEPLIDGCDFLAAAAGPGSTDDSLHVVEHPVLFVWMARLTGCVHA